MIPFRAIPLELTKDHAQNGRQARKGSRLKGTVRGRTTGWTVSPLSRRIHIPGSLIAQLSQGEDLSDGIHEHNVRYCKVSGHARKNILFIIDTSGSMVNDDRFGRVKGLIISLLESSYSKRVRVAVIGYGGGHAQLILPFTSSAELAAERITVLKGGGSTPLIPALGIAGDLVDRMQDENISVCIVSDGNYDRHATGNEAFQIEHFGYFCKSRSIPVILIYAGRTNKTALKRSMLLASKLGAEYYQLEDLRSATSEPLASALL